MVEVYFRFLKENWKTSKNMGVWSLQPTCIRWIITELQTCKRENEDEKEEKKQASFIWRQQSQQNEIT
jgi:hypothetical protein